MFHLNEHDWTPYVEAKSDSGEYRAAWKENLDEKMEMVYGKLHRIVFTPRRAHSHFIDHAP